MMSVPCGADDDFLLKSAPPSCWGLSNTNVGNDVGNVGNDVGNVSTDGRSGGGAFVTTLKKKVFQNITAFMNVPSLFV